MKTKDIVYVIRNHKPVRGVIIGMRGDEIAIDTGSELAYATIGSNYSKVFTSHVDACLDEAANMRKHANSARREADKKLEDAAAKDQLASELLADAARCLRKAESA